MLNCSFTYSFTEKNVVSKYHFTQHLIFQLIARNNMHHVCHTMAGIKI